MLYLIIHLIQARLAYSSKQMIKHQYQWEEVHLKLGTLEDSKIILQNRFTAEELLPKLENTRQAFVRGGVFSPQALNRDRDKILSTFDTRRQSNNSQKVVDDFLNPKFYQVPKEITKKYGLKFHERFNLFKDKDYEELITTERLRNQKQKYREGDMVQISPKPKKPVKPKDYLEISIHGGQIDERLKFSRYQSSEDSDAVQDFVDRLDVHESPKEEEIFLNMVERYRPKNYRNPSPNSQESSHDSNLFKGEYAIENEDVELDEQDILETEKPISNDQNSNDQSPLREKNNQVPFKSLVIRQKREKIMKFLMRQDSFSKELQQIEDFKLKSLLKGGKKVNVIEEREQQEKYIKKRIKEMEQKCYQDLVEKYSLIKDMSQKKRFKEDLLGRQFNFQLSFLSLDPEAKKRIREAFVKKKKMFTL
ncbi:UNKNOWN [Stylonychia lemnae]|uniref:Uncharacterized protein n=1 Tax=Stylonychia lemnae TaxID=5949 RepID=A0A077ZVT5_STYLE|nr:UNKNOWN [Stylonychia lemnae]|eukprot:CDW74060.1 UNKNOWN [Stylonychia lemnae]